MSTLDFIKVRQSVVQSVIFFTKPHFDFCVILRNITNWQQLLKTYIVAKYDNYELRFQQFTHSSHDFNAQATPTVRQNANKLCAS